MQNGVDIIREENAGFFADKTWTIYNASIYPTAGFSVRIGFDIIQFCKDLDRIFG